MHKRRKDLPLNSRLLSTLLAAMVALSTSAAVAGVSGPSGPAPRPTLVVGILVEGLSADYVDLLRSNMESGGFNRLISEGVTLRNVDYGPGIDATAATAILMTGAAPAVNGVPAARVWDSTTHREYPVLLDPSLAGNYAESQLTPKPLLVSTIGDEIRISDGGLGQIHSLASDAQAALIMAGHAGNSCYWLNDVNGHWITSSYFTETPTAIARRNISLPLASRLDTMIWTPSMELSRYPDLPYYKKLFPFRHTFPQRDVNRFAMFKESPLGNHELTSIATDYIKSQNLGQRGVTDMITLTADLTPYLHGREADNRIETMDAYLRLDRDIASLVQAIEKGPGMGSTLLFVAGTPAPSGSKRDEEKWNIPAGQFSPRKAVSLLNLYLMALHGNGEWVTGYHNKYFFLNADLIKERKLNAASVRQESAEFLAKMSGVSEVYTLDDIIARRAGDNPGALQRNVSPRHAGDLLVRINPGWEITDSEKVESAYEAQSRLPVERWQSLTSPVYILSPSLSPTEIAEPIDARAIAPTVTRILRIRSPNAASVNPLDLPAKK